MRYSEERGNELPGSMYMLKAFMYTLVWRQFMSSVRHKHVVLDQRKLDRARRALGTRTDRETIERALDVVATDERLDAHLRRLGGTMTLQKVFR
ncbi:MAG TPA: hypothetical protein VGK70_14180 [Thermoanaerobaculia bacterium]|jgi:hypothetical protein